MQHGRFALGKSLCKRFKTPGEFSLFGAGCGARAHGCTLDCLTSILYVLYVSRTFYDPKDVVNSLYGWTVGGVP